MHRSLRENFTRCFSLSIASSGPAPPFKGGKEKQSVEYLRPARVRLYRSSLRDSRCSLGNYFSVWKLAADRVDVHHSKLAGSDPWPSRSTRGQRRWRGGEAKEDRGPSVLTSSQLRTRRAASISLTCTNFILSLSASPFLTLTLLYCSAFRWLTSSPMCMWDHWWAQHHSTVLPAT